MQQTTSLAVAPLRRQVAASSRGVKSRLYVALTLVWKFLWCNGSVPLPLVNAR
jgi:hypothetical protein